jgi:ADP-heptose:LPS heptosyltransferase
MPDQKPKLLLIELWGLGDLVIATTFLHRAVERYDVTLLAKPHAAAMLARDFPQVRMVAWDAPWTAFRDKYRFSRWALRQIVTLLLALRRERFAAAVSVRADPRDHLVMWLANVRTRYGFPRSGSTLLLNRPMARSTLLRHRVEDWRHIGETLGLPNMDSASPALKPPLPTGTVPAIRDARPPVCVHLGARIGVRRWPTAYYRDIIDRLRRETDFHLTLIPDPDGYGADLADLADIYLPRLSLPELMAALGQTRLLICNDSAPAHLAAAFGRPVVAFFGPTEPVTFRPWGAEHLVVIRDLCPYRPCFDYCRFAEPYCLTRLLPQDVWPEVRAYVAKYLPRRNEANEVAGVVAGRIGCNVSDGP